MILKTTLTAVVAAVLATGALAQQAPTTTQQQTTSKAAVVSLIGCVAQAAPAPPVRGTTQPAPQGTAYKLVDVQPGTGTTVNIKTDSNFLLTVSASVTTPIDLGKFLNQWVEVTGTITPVPPVTVGPPPATPPAAGAAPLPTFTMTALKVVSTECK